MKYTVHDYKTLQKTITAFTKYEKLNMLFIVGSHGQGKTTHIENALGGDRTLWMEGQVSAFGLYRELWQNLRHTKYIVLDDVNTVRKDEQLVRLLKCLCQTRRYKNVAWHTTNHTMLAEDIPPSYTTDARVCFIVNEGKSRNKDFEALADRGLTINFKPAPKTILDESRKWFKDKTVIKFVEDHMKYIASLSMRDMEHASGMRQCGLDWKKELSESLHIKELLLVEELLNDRHYPTDEKRIKKFGDETGLSRTTWFQLAKQVKALPAKDKPKIRLSLDGLIKPKRKAVAAK